MKRIRRTQRRSARKKSLSPRRPVLKNRITVMSANQQRFTRINAPKLKSIVRRVLRAEGIEASRIELALVDDSTIRDLHRRFLRLDTPTDVLTFPFHEQGHSPSGEIVISVETAAREGPRHGLSAEAEVFLYAIHGILHLCGYDDQHASDARRMRCRQESLLQELSILDPFLCPARKP